MSDELTFEAALIELETIVSKLEDGQLSLDDSLALYERGQQLSTHCQKVLESASLRIEKLTADGEILELTSD